MKIWNSITKSFEVKPDNLPKIRVWDDILNEMVYGEWEQMDDGILFRFDKHLETEKPIYMLSSQLNDSNDIEVYDQDMVKVSYNGGGSITFVSRVHYCNGCFAFSEKTPFGNIVHNSTLRSVINHSNYSIEVIGNPFENSKLLKEHL